MGYNYKVANMAMPTVDLSDKSEKQLQDLDASLQATNQYGETALDVLSHFLGYEVNAASSVLSFTYNESGKDYGSLIWALEILMKSFKKLKISYDGEFIFFGEDWDNIVKYSIQNSQLFIYKAQISF